MFRNKKNKGFSLTELMVVISILAVLAAVLLPVFSAAKRSAKSVSASSKQVQIVKSLWLYAADDNDRLPTAASNVMSFDINNGIAPGSPYDLFTSMQPITTPLYPYTKSREIFQITSCQTVTDIRFKASCEFAFRYDDIAGIFGVSTGLRPNSSWAIMADGKPDNESDPSNGLINCTFLDSHGKKMPRLECLSMFTEWP